MEVPDLWQGSRSLFPHHRLLPPGQELERRQSPGIPSKEDLRDQGRPEPARPRRRFLLLRTRPRRRRAEGDRSHALHLPDLPELQDRQDASRQAAHRLQEHRCPLEQRARPSLWREAGPDAHCAGRRWLPRLREREQHQGIHCKSRFFRRAIIPYRFLRWPFLRKGPSSFGGLL